MDWLVKSLLSEKLKMKSEKLKVKNLVLEVGFCYFIGAYFLLSKASPRQSHKGNKERVIHAWQATV